MSGPSPRRPLVVSIAVVLVAINGAYNAVLGILLLLSRYDVPASDVLATSLVGAGVILFGLLTLAIASGIARGSRLSRLLLTVYLAVQFALHAYTVVASDAWDVTSIVQIVIEAAIVAVVWAPPGGRHFASRTPAPDPFAP